MQLWKSEGPLSLQGSLKDHRAALPAQPRRDILSAPRV